MFKKLPCKIGALVTLLILLSCTVLTAAAGIVDDTKDTYDVVRADDLDDAEDNADTDKSTGSDSGSKRVDDGGIRGDQIFGENEILGYDVKDRDYWEPFKPTNWLKLATVSDTLWQVFCLIFAALGLGCFSGSILAFLKGILAMVIAVLTNNDPDEAMATVDKETKKGTKLLKGIGTLALCMAGICFFMSLLV